jgi:hypothetical protein
MPTPCSPAKLAANRRNAQKSTGPVTEAGKAQSRRNALKHGLSGAGVVLPDADEAQLETLVREFETELKPSGALAKVLVRRAAVLSLRMERCVSQEAAAIAENVRHAEANFDETRLAQVEAAIAMLAVQPGASTRRLERAPEGLAWLVEQWEGLRDDLIEGVAWTRARSERLVNLLGRPWEPEFRPSIVARLCLAIETDDAGDSARLELASLAEAELERLATLVEEFDFEKLERDRAEAPRRATFDASRSANLARRYEAEAQRHFFRAISELRKLKKDQNANPSTTKASAELASSRAPEPKAAQPAPQTRKGNAERAVTTPKTANDEPITAQKPADPTPASAIKTQTVVTGACV